MATIAFGLSRQFQFSSIIDHQINKLRESGIIEKIERKWLQAPEIDTEQICGRAEMEVEVTLGLDSAKFFFYILLVGIAGAMTTLVIEFIVIRILRDK